eukprot:3709720-Lingulodinium_polyedra.AAC.1
MAGQGRARQRRAARVGLAGRRASRQAGKQAGRQAGKQAGVTSILFRSIPPSFRLSSHQSTESYMYTA